MRRAIVLVVLLLSGAFVIAADEKPATQPTTRATRSTGGRDLPQPWSLLTLEPEQRMKIREIHQKALDDIRAIRDKEEADILAVLTDAQKAELKRVEEEKKAAAKERRLQRK